jgi:DNA-binding response OmpR family regulator
MEFRKWHNTFYYRAAKAAPMRDFTYPSRFRPQGEEMAVKILIVDDDLLIARILKLTFERAGYEVALAHDGEEALRLVRKEKPALMILDLQLPVIDGYRVCAMVKEDERTRAIPIVILSGKDLSAARERGDLAADLYVEKPFNTTILLDKVSGLLRAVE